MLRIISMFMVIVLHILGSGGILSNTDVLSFENQFLYVFEILAFSAVNIFGIISGYVGINAQHKYKNIVKLWFQVMFYSLLGLVVELILKFTYTGYVLTFKDIIQRLFPTIFNEWWYFSAYFALFFFMPMLNYIINNFSRNKLKLAFVFILIFFTIFDAIYENPSFGLQNGYTFIWLSILYCVGAYMKKYDIFSKLTSKKCILYYFIANLIILLYRVIITYTTNAILGNPKGYNIWAQYNNIFVLLSAMFLVAGFSKIEPKKVNCKIIAKMAPYSFGVFLIHTLPVCRNFRVDKFIMFLDYNVFVTILLVLSTATAMYLVCTFIDAIRLQIFKVLKVERVSIGVVKVVHKIFNRFILKTTTENIEDYMEEQAIDEDEAKK